MIEGDFSHAVDSLEQALRLDPNHKMAQERLKVTRVRIQLEPQLEAAKRGAEDRPDDVAAVAQLASLYYMLGRFSEAEKYYKRVIELRPDDYQGGD